MPIKKKAPPCLRKGFLFKNDLLELVEFPHYKVIVQLYLDHVSS